MKELNAKQIETIIDEIEQRLLSQERIKFTFDKKWSSNFPNAPGIYFIFDNDVLIYIGESSNIMERMKKVKRTVNHTFRRKLCLKLYGTQPILKSNYPSQIEAGLNDYYVKNLSFSAVEMRFGRLETETHFINKHKVHGIINSIGKRE